MKVLNSSRIFLKFQNRALFSGVLFPRFFSTAVSSSDSAGDQPKAPENPEQQSKKPKKVYRFDMNPHAYWLLRGRGMERPYTGDYWCTKDTGHYACLACSNKLFL